MTSSFGSDHEMVGKREVVKPQPLSSRSLHKNEGAYLSIEKKERKAAFHTAVELSYSGALCEYGEGA